MFRLPIRRRDVLEQELDDEIGLHLEMRIEQLTRGGLSPEDARHEALRRFGSLEAARRELYRAAQERETRMRLRDWWDDLRQDVVFATRTLRKSPGFTAAVVLTLALGIGASSSMFTVVDAVLLRPFGYVEPERLAVLNEISPEGEVNPSASPANVSDWREQSRTFQSIAAWVNSPVVLTGDGDPEEVTARVTTGNYFSLLASRPQLGRTYSEQQETEQVAVLSHRFWQRRFGGDPSIVGRTVTLNDQAFTVLGVMAHDFPSVGDKPEIWLPMELNPEWRGRYLQVIARLRPGADLLQAEAEMVTIGQRLADEFPEFNKGWGIAVTSLEDAVAGEVRPALLILLGAVGFLLLIACANVANLLLSRAAVRRKEVALRNALGATRGRVLRQLLTESLVLAMLAGALGLLIAVLGTRVLLLRIPAELALPRLDEIGVNLRVVGFTAGVSLLTGILFGLAPAGFGATSIRPWETLRDAARGSTAGRERGRLRGVLVITEVALALVLLVGAGLLARSFQKLTSVDTGVATDNLLTMRLAARSARYDESAALLNFTNELTTRLQALPGARNVGIIGPWLPLTGLKSAHSFRVEDRPPPAVGEEPGADIRFVTGDYYRAMGIPLLRGRVFDARDTETSPDVFVINEAFAKEHFPGEDPIGKRISTEWFQVRSGEIVGVVGDIRELGPAEQAAPAFYLPFAKQPSSQFHVVMRTTGNPEDLAAAARNVVRSIDPNQPVAEIRTMEQVASDLLARQRMNLLLLGGFAALAILLAAIGIYGVIAYSVNQRRQEIGVRVALGASRRAVLSLVVGQGMRLALLGLVLGVVGALLVTRLMESMLFGVTPTDPLTLAAVAAFLAAVALLASWVPALRAAATEPTVALRTE